MDDAIRIAWATGATSVRFYPRYEGFLEEVLEKITKDIRYLAQFDDCGLTFTIEQHEDLKSHEIVALVQNSGMKNLSILFDFANMINANEDPLSALEVMAPYITQVHIKDAKRIREGGAGRMRPVAPEKVTFQSKKCFINYYCWARISLR